MKSYNSTLTGLKSKSLFTATLLLPVALNFIGIIQLSAQEHVDIDTLLYCYHNPEQDQYPDMLPEDCYMELYLENGTLKKGYFGERLTNSNKYGKATSAAISSCP